MNFIDVIMQSVKKDLWFALLNAKAEQRVGYADNKGGEAMYYCHERIERI